MSKLVCLGFGNCARHFADGFGSRFATITGTSRTPAKHKLDKRADAAAEILAFDGRTASPQLRAAVANATHLLISAAPGESGDPVLNALGGTIAEAEGLQSIVYLSSFGVYGDHGGDWIDESAPTTSGSARGGARIAAEQAWRALGRQRSTPAAILRLAGIYGPGENAFTRLLAGRAHRIAKPGHVSNRIHVADIAQAIAAAFERRYDGIVNVTDDSPVPPGEPIEFAAALLGMTPPPEISYDEAKRTLSPMLMSFYDGCARVKNERLKRDLGVTLLYPDYRAGLRALFDAR